MRIIDADAIKRSYQEVLCNRVACIDCSFFMDDKYCKFETMLSEAPTVDAVPVVRCGKCKHFRPYEGEEHKGDCAELVGLESCVYKDDFCSYGERKDGDGNG